MVAAAKRGCGFRVPGDIYMESVGGTATVDDCLIDPPIPIPAGLEIPARGVLIMQRPGTDGDPIWDVYDHVGSNHYPNVADFVEETRRFGLSRKISRNENLHLLDDRSVIILCHERAVVEQADFMYQLLWEEADEYPSATGLRCPQHKHTLDQMMAARPGANTCAGLWYEMIQGGDASYDPDKPPRTVTREVGSTRYEGRKTPEGFTPRYREGFFLSSRLSNLTVIKDPEGGEDIKAMQKASQSKLTVRLEDS
jgi:hypothetical protein